MSSNNLKSIMKEVAKGFQRKAMASLQTIKECFDQEGRRFDEQFKMDFLEVSTRSVAVAYFCFELELSLDARYSGNDATNRMNLNSTNNSIESTGANPIRSVAESNSSSPLDNEDSGALKRETDEASVDNTILVVDSDDEGNWHEEQNASTSQKNIGTDFVLVNDVVMENDDERTASINRQRNNKHNDGTEMKMEIIEPKQEEANDGDDILVVLVQVGTTSLMDVSANAQIRKNDEGLNENKQRTSNDNNSISFNKISRKKAANNKKRMQKLGGKRHKCRFCEYSSNFTKDVEKHERTHTGEKPYQCKRCNKRFTQLIDLKRHAKVHAKEFAFHCPGCFEGFSHKTEQEAHVKVCKVTRYECHICKMNSFAKKSDLERHLQTHSGEKPFRSEICLKCFTQKSTLKKHLNNVHNRIRK